MSSASVILFFNAVLTGNIELARGIAVPIDKALIDDQNEGT
jgi:hypothetical protein